MTENIVLSTTTEITKGIRSEVSGKTFIAAHEAKIQCFVCASHISQEDNTGIKPIFTLKCKAWLQI